MLVHTDYLFFNTRKRQEFVRITDEVAAIVKTSGVAEGIALVSAMHITSGVVSDWGRPHPRLSGLARAARAGRTHAAPTGEDNADAHLKRTIMGHQVVCRPPGARSISAVGAGVLCGVRRSAKETGGGKIRGLEARGWD